MKLPSPALCKCHMCTTVLRFFGEHRIYDLCEYSLFVSYRKKPLDCRNYSCRCFVTALSLVALTFDFTIHIIYGGTYVN